MMHKFLNWSHDNGAPGMLLFVLVGTLACCTGAAIPIIIADAIGLWSDEKPAATKEADESEEAFMSAGAWVVAACWALFLLVLFLYWVKEG